ncbi:MAG TPA: hypothetical protein DHV62_03165 [Elusimicrobia bacterium]|nr:hypothetical protein [Elusimicrobiota bacterium]
MFTNRIYSIIPRVSRKYANKAYPLVLLEAGHVMQNAYLYCAEKGIGFVEVLGFDQEELSKRIALNEELDLVVIGAHILLHTSSPILTKEYETSSQEQMSKSILRKEKRLWNPLNDTAAEKQWILIF